MDNNMNSEFYSAEEDSIVELSTLKVRELKKILKQMKLSTHGNKADLIERIKHKKKDGVNVSNAENANEGKDDDENISESESETSLHTSTDDDEGKGDLKLLIELMKQSHVKKPMIKFQDVEDTIPPFSGDKGEHVVHWLSVFEATAEIANWNSVEKIINAKRKFTDSARLFAQFECRAKTWDDFKKELVNEFAETLNTKQVHKQLSTTKKIDSESLQEYVYRMLQIASQIDIEIESQIQYIIEGIPDDERNKSMLYGATSIKELRKKLRDYETFKSNLNKNSMNKAGGEKILKSQPKQKRCFNCGGSNHLSNNCPEKDNGPKCFKCGKYGHIAPKCKKAEKISMNYKPDNTRVDLLENNDNGNEHNEHNGNGCKSRY